MLHHSVVVNDDIPPGLTATIRSDPAASPTPGRSWPAYAAAWVAFAFAAVSLYWGAGGTVGIGTLGGHIEEMALARDPVMVMMVWVTGVLKVLGGLLALALVQPWGRRLPRRWLLLGAWTGAVGLTVYGLLQVTSVALIAFGVISPTHPVEITVLWWRGLLWEPWFLVWGILLGLTAWTGRTRRLTSTSGSGAGDAGRGAAVSPAPKDPGCAVSISEVRLRKR